MIKIPDLKTTRGHVWANNLLRFLSEKSESEIYLPFDACNL